LCNVRHSDVSSLQADFSGPEVDYLAACPPSGLPVAIGGIDYAESPGRAPDSWDEQAPDGTIVGYETTCTLMRKELS
jgi:hypothetical protein